MFKLWHSAKQFSMPEHKVTTYNTSTYNIIINAYNIATIGIQLTI